MRFISILTISLFIHLFLLCSIYLDNKKIKEKEFEKKIVHLKIKHVKKKERFFKRKTKKGIKKTIRTFKDLAYKKEDNYDQYQFQGTEEFGADGEGSELVKLFESINAHTTYPEVFIEKEIFGVVEASLSFLNGRYSEKYSKFSGSNNFLKVHMIRILREALKEQSFQFSRVRMKVKVSVTFAEKDQFSKNYIKKFNYIAHNYLAFIIQPKSDLDAISLHGNEQEKKITIDFTRLMKEKTTGDKLFRIYMNDPAW